MSDMKTLGQVGFEKYGDTAGIAGPWKTFDGRDMPRWDELEGDAGEVTKLRWEMAMLEVLRVAKPYLERGEAPPGYRWAEVGACYVQTGERSGAAISPRATGA